jgi:hydrogenase nickel incorporation protein HypB
MTKAKKIEVEKNVFARNDEIAKQNREYFDANNIFVVNLVSSPGSGKTTLLEVTLTELKERLDFFVIEGDLQTENDANRIRTTGVQAYQINTDGGCHLDSSMIQKALQYQKSCIKKNSVLFIENVGNLVCPSYFDLGEHKRVVVISVTEGDDKPIKYPNMFQSSDLCIINKIDLLEYVDFDIDRCVEYVKQVNSKLEIITLSTKTGENMGKWYEWIEKNQKSN